MNDLPRSHAQRAPVVLCSFDDDYAARFTRALESSCATVHVSPLQDAITSAAETLSPDVIVFDLQTVKTEHQTIFDLIRQLSQTHPQIQKIALGHPTIADEAIAAMKAGACDFLDRDASPAEIEELVLDHLLHASNAPVKRAGNVIAIVGAKPSGHESFLATNLAVQLATTHSEQSVLLLDLDLECTDLPIDFDVEITYSLHDAIQEHLKLERSMLDHVLARHKTGLFLLPLTLKRDSNDEVSPQALASILGSLRSLFDVIVINASCLRNELCRSYLMTLCDHVLVVVLQQIGWLRAAQEQFAPIDIADKSAPRVQLIIADHDDDIDLPIAKINKHVGLPAIATLPPAPADLANSHNAGVPLILAKPKARYSRAVAELAEELFPAAVPQGASQVAKRVGALLGLSGS